LCFVLSGNGDDHGVRRADTARALARWRYLVASHEATDTLHRSMCLAPYLPGGMVVTIAPTTYEGRTAPPWWSYLWDCCVGVYSTFRTIPTVESYGAGVFSFSQNPYSG
jgi:hypothetical protein